ncbi:hypothetical protein F5051DRAFT_354695 [Lentinula edodes]|nr:hypothetical protein F5051DRAFT_354695 [Lentinula edodes]
MTRCETRPPPPCAIPTPPPACPPVALPPVTSPPVPRPPVTGPPAANPPGSRPPVTNPPGSRPPTTSPPSSNLPLVLRECNIKVWIVDVHSWVTLSQQFQNPSSSVATHVTYTFSMLAGAAIYGFQIVRQDGTKVDGVVKQKDEAQKEMDIAVSEGLTAALGQEVTKDVFSIGIGNVAGNETITINLSYMSPLIDDEDRNQLRFTLPRSYMERYGRRPAGVTNSRLDHENVPFTMDVLIQQRGTIRSVSSPSGYNFTFGLGRPPNISPSPGIPDSNIATATIRRGAASSARARDVMLIITADRLDNPRAFIETHPSPNHTTAAIGLTLVPHFGNSNYCPEMEYIVLVDRSGSMQGVKMEMTRQALIVLLQGLPSRGSFFNIFSYGTKATSLWPRSRAYDQATVNEARRHLDSMQADYGGTEIPNALDAVFASLPSRLTRPVSIFLLTDGGVWGSLLIQCVTRIESTIASRSSDKSFLRVYTIGIGDGVSTETCDRIARAGGGTSTYIVSDNEQYIGKCTRLVRAARTPPIVDIEVTWVTPKENASHDATGQVIDLFDAEVSYDDEECGGVGPLAPILQAPDPVPSFYRSTRTQVYAIVPDSIAVTKEIKISGRIPVTGASVALTIPVQRFSPFAPFPASPGGIGTGTAFLHTLAAKALIQDREDWEDSGSGPAGKPSVASLKEDITRLGIDYKLTSRYTSLIAVDRRNQDVLGMGYYSAPGAKKPKKNIVAVREGSFIPSFQARSLAHATFSSTPGGIGRAGADTATEALIILARLQNFDGSFDESSSKFDIEGLYAELGVDLGTGTETETEIKSIVDKFVSDTESEKGQVVYITLLAWAFMAVQSKSNAKAGEAFYDVKDKADVWLKENLKGSGAAGSDVDVDELKRQFLDKVASLGHGGETYGHGEFDEYVDSDEDDFDFDLSLDLEEEGGFALGGEGVGLVEVVN